MNVTSLCKYIIKSPLRWMLSLGALRRRAVFEVKQNYFSDMEFSIPLSEGFICPISASDHLCSFSEVFFGSEYDAAWKLMPLPTRWLDIGCHAGYFSLYVAWLRARAGIREMPSALLIDADSRSQSAVDILTRQNKLTDAFQFARGAISQNAGSVIFSERAFMSSSVEKAAVESEDVKCLTVPVITAAEIISRLPPPYDLIKIDIEGGEYDFLAAYGEVMEASRFLILEWHSWHPGGNGRQGVLDIAQAGNFELISDLVFSTPVEHAGASAQCGVLLFQNRRRHEGSTVTSS